MKECRHTINKRSVTAWDLAHLIGLLSSTAQCGTPPSSRLCQRALQIFQGNYDHETESDLQWWVKHVRGSDGHPVVHPSADMILTTDASKSGWGATDKENSTGGIWTQDERKAHINWRQFYYPCRPSSRQDRIFTSCYCSTTHQPLHTKHFRVLSNLALEIWEWCSTRIKQFMWSVQHCGRCRVETSQVTERYTREFSINFRKYGALTMLFYLQQATASFFQLQTRPESGGSGCPGAVLVRSESLCFFPHLLW